MSQDTHSKSTQERSPRFPSDSLGQCIEIIEKAYAEIGRSSVPSATVAKAIGYASLSGASRSTLASLSYYNLIERSGNNYRVSDLAIRIIRQISDSDKAAAIQQASREPKGFVPIFNEHSDCSESVLSSILIHKGFTEDGAKRAAKIFRDNLEFVKQFSSLASSNPTQERATVGLIEPDLGTENPPKTPKTTSDKSAMPATVSSNELPIPIGENLIARIPFPMTEEDFDLFIGTLNLWKRKLVKTPPKADGAGD